jgi:SAF domain
MGAHYRDEEAEMSSVLRATETAERAKRIAKPGEGVLGKQRHMKFASLGALITVLCALGIGVLFARKGETRMVFVAARQIPAGTVLTMSDLRTVQLPVDVDVRSIPGNDTKAVEGKVAQLPIAEGSVLVAEELSVTEKAPAGSVLVGVSLEPGALPTPDIRHGDRVEVYAAAPDGKEAVLLTQASVWKVWSGAKGVQSASSRVVITLVVPQRSALGVAQAASVGRVRLGVVGSADPVEAGVADGPGPSGAAGGAEVPDSVVRP